MAPKFRILSIDGGGLKGLIAIKMLRELEQMLGGSIVASTDLLAGTSTGGLIAAALSVRDGQMRPRYDLGYIENIYMEVGMEVFGQGRFSLSGKEITNLRKILGDTFGDLTLTDVLRPLFVPAYDATHDRIIVFKTRSALADVSKNIPLVDVCLATSAIPPVFPPHTVKYEGKMIACEDAGFHLKNPSVSCLAEVFKHRHYYHAEGLKEEHVALLSVSTGSHRGGGKDWDTDITNVLSRNGSDMRYVRSQKLRIDFEKVRYLRLDLDLGHGGFSIAKIAGWMDRIRRLGEDRAFADTVRRVLT
jgi:patatin-like phospholipase/acyl hydrolase